MQSKPARGLQPRISIWISASLSPANLSYTRLGRRCATKHFRPALEHVPPRLPRPLVHFPQATAAQESVAVVPTLNPARQASDVVHVAAAQHDRVRNESAFQLCDGITHFLAPGTLPHLVHPWNTKKILDLTS